MPIIGSLRLYLCCYRIWCVMPWLLVVGSQVQSSRLCAHDEGNCHNWHNFPHPGRIVCCPAPNSRPPPTKALHTICGNNTSIVSSSRWLAYKCPKHIGQIISAMKRSVASSWFSSLRLYYDAWTNVHQMLHYVSEANAFLLRVKPHIPKHNLPKIQHTHEHNSHTRNIKPIHLIIWIPHMEILIFFKQQWKNIKLKICLQIWISIFICTGFLFLTCKLYSCVCYIFAQLCWRISGFIWSRQHFVSDTQCMGLSIFMTVENILLNVAELLLHNHCQKPVRYSILLETM